MDPINMAYSIPVSEARTGMKFRNPNPDGYNTKKYAVNAAKFMIVRIVRILLV